MLEVPNIKKKKINLLNVLERKLTIKLTHQTLKFPSYRNRSIYSQIKSTDWFLYDGNFNESDSIKIMNLKNVSVNFFEHIQ